MAGIPPTWSFITPRVCARGPMSPQPGTGCPLIFVPLVLPWGLRWLESGHPQQLARPSRPFPSLPQLCPQMPFPQSLHTVGQSEVWGAQPRGCAAPPAHNRPGPSPTHSPLSRCPGGIPALPRPRSQTPTRSPATGGSQVRSDTEWQPQTEHLPAVHPPAALAFSTHTRRFARFCLRLGAAWGGQGGAGLGAGGCERGEERSVSALESFGMQRAGPVSSGMNAASPFLSRPCCHLPNSPQLPGKEAGMKPGRVV